MRLFSIMCMLAALAGPQDGEAPARGTVAVDFRGALVASVFYAAGDPEALHTEGMPEDVKARIARFKERCRGFPSRITSEQPLEPGPELWLEEKRTQMERAIMALIERPGIEPIAADYAKKALLFYEWEGMSEGPLAEAGYAETFLKDHPDTPIKPYLNLFLAHRYRCAVETLAREKDPEREDQADLKYRQYLAAALADPDLLARLAAADLERQPYVYRKVPNGAEEPEPGRAGDCPDTARAEPVPDPRAWSLSCFEISSGPKAGDPGTLETFEDDLDGDGIAELFVGSSVARGGAGGTWYVFRKAGDGYGYLGSVYLHRGAYRVLPPDGSGKPRIARYLRLGAGEGQLDTLVYDGRAFAVVGTEKVSAQGADAARLADLFGPAFAPAPAAAAGPGEPSLSIGKALETAEKHIKKTRVDTSGQYIHSVTLRYDDRPESRGQYWDIQWTYARPRLGGEISMRVYMDGRVTIGRLGP